MRRTLHVAQLPSQTVLKKRRVEVAASGDDIKEEPLGAHAGAEPSAAADAHDAARNLPDSLSGVRDFAVETSVDAVGGGEDDEDEEDDDEATERLVMEAQRLKKLKERSSGAGVGSSGNSVLSAYNSDVVFRRGGAQVAKLSAIAQQKQKQLRHSNLQASDDHKDFLKNYFR